MAKDRCQCPEPGGECRCEVGQLAACGRVNGKIYASCTTPPRGKTNNQLKNWVLEQVTGIRRYENQQLSQNDMMIIKEKKYFDGDREVYFEIDLTVGTSENQDLELDF